jgi:hypothetical protein
MAQSLALLICVLGLAGDVFPQAPFYQGKTIKIISASPAGGSGDLRIKAAVPFLRKHIPGNPTVVIICLAPAVASLQITCLEMFSRMG